MKLKSKIFKVPKQEVIDSPCFTDEPIQFCNNIQSHGVLLVLEEPELTVSQVSNNTSSLLGVEPAELLGQNLGNLFHISEIDKLKQNINNDEFKYLKLIKLRFKQKNKLIDGIIHRNTDNILILELENFDNQQMDYLSYYHLIKASATKLEKAASLQEMCQQLVTQLRKATGFDRVMVYKFSSDWNGLVIAEDKRKDLQPLVGLHFPEEDTRAGRPMFTENYVRLIPDINLPPAEILSSANFSNHHPLDLTDSVLRGVSPCLVEYLNNMGCRATLVISLVKQQKLWGLISCHHYSGPKYLSYEVRQACEFLGQMMSSLLAVKEENENSEYKLKLKKIQAKLLKSMHTETQLIDSLVEQSNNLLDLVGATGAVICIKGEKKLIGKTPPEDEIDKLMEWLDKKTKKDNTHTKCLPRIYPAAEKFKDIASGLVKISISQNLNSYLVWFRPEVIQTVNWAGHRDRPFTKIESEGVVRYTPRSSFEKWKEIVRFTSLPWQAWEIEAAKELRNAIVNIVLYQTEKLAKLAGELKRSNEELEKFAYVASHDLREPLNIVSSYVQLLEMRYGEELDRDAKDYIGFAVEGVQHMEKLIDDLLAYSRVGTRGQEFEPTEVETAFQRAIANLQFKISETGAVITHDPFPTVMGDPIQLVQLFQNFIGNSIKFRSDRPPAIHVGVKPENNHWLFSVKDNGIGLDPKFSDRIFVIFQRLHTREEYSGSGIGLSICKKIIERHRGKIWVSSTPGEGTTFFFTIPRL